MALETLPPAILRFGTFEVDLRAGELRKQGKRVKVQDQPFQVLFVLLRRPGDLVTREELRAQIWPEDTFVDFDNSLNTAINKLREALGDSADNPRFIETLPRRGYRFLAQVNGEAREKPASRFATRNALFVSIAVLAAIAAAGAWLWHTRGARVLTEKDTIVLGDFANFTGDPVFDGTLREGLSVQLQQSPFLGLVSEDGIHEMLRMMGQSTRARVTREIAREVCQRTNSRAALDGSIALIGTRYNLILRAVNCASGEVLASTEAQSNDKSHVLDALSKAASDMRSKLGESLSTVQKYNTPLEQATTPSLEALQAFTLSTKSEDWPSAIPSLQRAIEIDPGFAMAYNQLGNAYQSVGETVKGADNMRKAFELRERMTELEKLEVEGDYYRGVAGDLSNAKRSYALGKQIYPREPQFPAGLGLIYNFFGQYESGLKEHKEALRLLPNDSVAFRMVAYTDVLLDRVEDGVALTREAQAKGLEGSLGPTEYAIAFLQNDAPEMARQVSAAAGKTGEEDQLLALDSDTAAFFGHLRRARERSRQASGSARREGENEAGAAYEAIAALREGLFGNTIKAEEQARVAAKYPGGRDEDYGLALAFLYAGNANSAQRLVDGLSRKFPEDTIVQFNYLPALRAKLALLRSNPQQASKDLEPAAPYELGLPAIGYYNWPNMYPVYVRGEAYLAAHQGLEAAAEFQKILNHRGIVLNEPIGVLAHLQLGRAYAMLGDSTKARAAYQDFLTLWKDADPDIPILKQAKAEYAKLQ